MNEQTSLIQPIERGAVDKGCQKALEIIFQNQCQNLKRKNKQANKHLKNQKIKSYGSKKKNEKSPLTSGEAKVSDYAATKFWRPCR